MAASRSILDEGPYELSNICGALVPESLAVLGLIASGAPVEVARERALEGSLFPQRSWQTRRRFWHAVHARYLRDVPAWILGDLAVAAARGPADPAALGLLYLHFVLRDHVTRDWITGPLWDRWRTGRHRLTRHDVLADLEGLIASTDVRWTEGSRKKHATSLLSALRDYGVARGVQVKHLQRPALTSEVAAHLLRILVEQGVRGSALIEHPMWRIFLRTSDDVAGELATLALAGRIRFERAGSTVVLETPWSET